MTYRAYTDQDFFEGATTDGRPRHRPKCTHQGCRLEAGYLIPHFEALTLPVFLCGQHYKLWSDLWDNAKGGAQKDRELWARNVIRAQGGAEKILSAMQAAALGAKLG